MIRYRLSLPLFILFLVFCTCNLTAQRSVSMNIERLVRDAGMIFAGRVINVETGERDKDMNLFVTHYTFLVTEKMYGVESDTIVINQYGGEADGQEFYPKGVPRFYEGEDVLVFFYPPSKIGMSSPVGMDQGKFMIRYSEKEKRLVVANKLGNENLFRGVKRVDKIAETEWLKMRKPGELPYSEFSETVRELIEEIKNML